MYSGSSANERVSGEGHTGCHTLGGTFRFFHGPMDSECMVAHTTFVARCDQEWDPHDIFEAPVEGIVEWQWTVDLSVSH